MLSRILNPKIKYIFKDFGLLSRMSVTTYKYLNQDEATHLDMELFDDYKFSVDQLMELAGLSIAIAVAKVFPLGSKQEKVLIICGPGNNGGDGLVAARHLNLFGYSTSVLYPKRTRRPLYENLLCQCEKYGVSIIDALPTNLDKEYHLVLDALFGFSFKPPVREEMKPYLHAMINTTLPVSCVDIPSGWDVNNGPPPEEHINPKLLISLSAPKLCAKYLKDSKHYLGGRFIPKAMQEKYGLKLPLYPETEQVVPL